MRLLRFEESMTIVDRQSLSDAVTVTIDAFVDDMIHPQPITAEHAIHSTSTSFPAKKEEVVFPVAHSDRGRSFITIHLYEPALFGIPALALQGWIDLILARHIISNHDNNHQFNFRRSILPLMNVSGMAKQVIRYLVFHLENGLKQAKSARLVLDMAHDQELLHYLLFRISPSKDDQDNYNHLIPHHWTRAIVVCKKFQEYAVVSLLQQRSQFGEITSFWRSSHDYLLPEDIYLLKRLADISNSENETSYSDQLITMFKVVHTHLLNE